ncbi:hypothetical protein HELRODRAFT_165507 [Helobdella robusta]|uniref:LRRNT domain-containing protein n=1 Tax=Helobdella robusta TaxID=6412 RepID=T1EWX9_HELRO|nr:hypothetical protein HELRODRAFT_165507 [Helobdella robusta]ESN91469.1 hypothetical protein HELRODRAFT_165507 [Helobdella robusta]
MTPGLRFTQDSRHSELPFDKTLISPAPLLPTSITRSVTFMLSETNMTDQKHELMDNSTSDRNNFSTCINECKVKLSTASGGRDYGHELFCFDVLIGCNFAVSNNFNNEKISGTTFSKSLVKSSSVQNAATSRTTQTTTTPQQSQTFITSHVSETTITIVGINNNNNTLTNNIIVADNNTPSKTTPTTPATTTTDHIFRKSLKTTNATSLNTFMPSTSLLLLLILAHMKLVGGNVVTCYRKCLCDQSTMYMHCSGKNLEQFPDFYMNGTLDINLNSNNFRVKVLRKSNMTLLLGVRNLYISDNSIEHIHEGTFEGMTNLEILDIGKNKLTVIRPNTFRGLKLKHLFLNDNRMIQLLPDSFLNLQTTTLHLQNCSMTELRLEVLGPLRGGSGQGLTNLWLNDNLITKLEEGFKELLVEFTHFSASQPFEIQGPLKK